MRRIIFTLLCSIIFVGTFTSIITFREQMETNNREKYEQGKSGALEALDFWTQSRAYPDNDIPQDKYMRAFQSAKLKTKEISSVLSSGSIWDAIGPINLQGRSLSVAINPLNPNTVYVGTASGGLWRSYTGGLSADWQLVKLGYPALGISAIVIDPTDTNTIFIGTGEVYRYQGSMGGVAIRTTRGSYGIGILKTTDGGGTWTKSLDWSYNQQRGIQALKMNPLNHNTLFAATTEGIYKTADAGTTWKRIFFVYMGEDIVIDPIDTNRVMISFGNFTGSHVYVTTNGGTNWSQSPLPGYSGKVLLEIYSPHPNVVYASAADSTTDFGGLYRTTDFGTSWVLLQDYPLNSYLFQVQGWYSHFVAVKQDDSSKIIHAGVPVSKSTNGGASFFWSSGIYSDNHGYAYHPTNTNIIYVVDDDGVYRSTDFGSSFSNVGYGMQTGQIYNGFSCSATDSLLALAQSQDHIPGYRYLGSMTWDHGSAKDESGWTAINQSNDNTMFAVSRFGQYVYRSLNRGASFSFSGGYFGEGAWNSPVVIARSNPDIVYVGNTRIYKTLSNGGSWSATNGGLTLDGNPALSMAVSATNPDTVYVGMVPVYTSAHIYRTINGGDSWTNITSTLPDRYPMDIAVDPTNSSIVYAAFSGFGSGHLYKSTDAGTNWTNISGSLPDAPTTAIVVDPLHTNIVYVGNDIGVYVSTDGGGTWSTFSAGLPDAVIVADLAISPSNRTLRVATHGNGVYERKLLNELPIDYFDYKAAQLNYPADGLQFNLGTTISLIRASFKSLSVQSRLDSFDVKYRILLGNIELYSNTQRIDGLASGETRTIVFNGSFTPSQDETYNTEAISLASDNNSSNDTLRGTVTFVAPPTVSNWTVTKTYSPYTEIIGGSPGPVGDDERLRVPLPFTFTYDNRTYDSAQISTNGWLELGRGTPGYLYGLSTVQELGTFFEPTLAEAKHPTKALGPWWTDLSAGTGQITYTTIGSTPNQTFVVQWKNVPAYCCDPSTTMTLNFQLKLHETTNMIEFCYGSVSGALASYTGASIGLKDYAGGDYRFYDIYSKHTGLVSDLNSYLDPLNNWPGQDSVYQIATNIEGVTVALKDGWNLVSLPVTRSDHSFNSIFSTFIGGTAFTYTGSYQPVDSCQYGSGFWIKTSMPANQLIPGSELLAVNLTAHVGWNIIGSVDHEIPAPSGGIITSSVYGYTDSGYYYPTSILKPGQGYWIKTSSSGTIALGPQATPKVVTENIKTDMSITLTDKFGKMRTLLLAEHSDGENLDRYELPPLPPGEVFDVRFASQRMLESYPNNLKQDAVYLIQMQSPAYPLTISFKANNSATKEFILEEMSNNNIIANHKLSGEGKLVITNGDERTLRLRITNGKQIPTQFALKQNYPNPFNPTTTITFDLPIKGTVSLVVYDILGKEVMKLADGEFEAGSHTAQADFNNLASGVYLYMLKAGSFTDVKKMVLTK